MEQAFTPFNQALAETLSRRVASELSVVSGRNHFWRAIGVGFLISGLGAALGIGFYGYSLITRNGSQMEEFSKALQSSLSTVSLHGSADGKVRIETPELTLAKGATISLDPSTRLLVDANAKVAADGEIRIQTPSISIPRGPTPKTASQARTISNFTIFKAVAFEQGSVLTGWTFLTSAQEAPTQQYCYYHQKTDSDLAIQVNLAIDGTPEPEKTIPKAFDFSAALSRCVWFNRSSQ